jgi:hypothetical protein
VAGGTGQPLITAFRPSQDLTYTPLTQTSNGGRTWSALSPLDAALAGTPDSLAAQPGTGGLLALLATGTAEQADAAGTRWATLASARTLAATAAGRSCGLRALTAVTYTPAGAPLLAGACTQPGVVGIFAAAGTTWLTAGPVLTGALARQPITVLRLSTTGDQITALLTAGTGRHAVVLAAWSTDGGAKWTLSSPLATGGHQIVAASFGPDQTAAVVTAGGRGAALSAGKWQQLPALPAGSAALVPGTDGRTEVLAVHRGTLTVWQVTSSSGSWAKAQLINVPIQYGSSG